MLADHPLPATVIFASFTGEEGGLLGSREFVRRAVADKLHVVGALNNDMVGWANDERLDNTIRYSNPGIRDIQHGAAMLFTRLITYDALYFKGTDAASLYDAYGDVIGGIGSYPVLGSPHYHQAERPAGVREPPAHHRDQQDDRRDGDAAGVEPVAADEPEGGQLHWHGRLAVVDAEPGAGHRVVHRRVRAAGGSAAASRHRDAKPQATLPQVAPGTIVSVKAVNARGLEGWDWAKTTVGEPHATRITQ